MPEFKVGDRVRTTGFPATVTLTKMIHELDEENV